jgi:hypothetical protein
MKAVGMLLVVVGIAVLAIGLVLGCTSYHLTRAHDAHKLIVWMAVGLVIAIIGGLVARRGDE